MIVPLVIIGILIAVSVSAKQRAASAAATPLPVAKPTAQPVCGATGGTELGAPTPQVEAAHMARPGYSTAQENVIPAIGYDAADAAIEGLFG